MPILSPIESRSLRGRLVHGVIILALSIGGLTMVYPFLVMISGSLKSEMDVADFDVVPKYLYDHGALYRKFLETKYNQDIAAFNHAHRTSDYSFSSVAVPTRVSAAAADDAAKYLNEARPPAHWMVLGAIDGLRTDPERIRLLRDRLYERYRGDLNALSRETGSPITNWREITVRPPDWLSARFEPANGPVFEEYLKLCAEAPPAEIALVSLTGRFLEQAIYPIYGRGSTAAYNTSHRLPLSSYSDFTLPPTVLSADDPRLRAEWLSFVRDQLNPSFVLLHSTELGPYRSYLAERYGSVENLNRAWSRSYASFAEIALPAGEWLAGAARADYRAFLQTRAPESYRLTGPEYSWTDWLASRYPTVEALNRSHGSSHTALAQAPFPADQLEWQWVMSRPGAIRTTAATRNFAMVFRELLGQGTVLRNTAIYCIGAVVISLVVNPLAAYALSRFQLPGTFKLLLAMILTMAFPTMVTLIPTFIMLGKLNLLNTFAALLLPAAANGYLIFLLKGFFDSLPREIYEAASIDGAGELRMFFQITLALSVPILAVVGLSAFTHAYVTFLYALVVCPREEMWVMSVWLYQWQGLVTAPAMFASVLVAAVPMILMFLLTQKLILRGLVVPSEK